MAYIWILLIIIILLLGLLIYLNIKDSSQSSDSNESLRDLDKAVERQETKLSNLSDEIKSFQKSALKAKSKIEEIPVSVVN